MNSEDKSLAKYLTEPQWVQDCEGWTRRTFLKTGLTALLGLSMLDMLQLRAFGSPVRKRKNGPTSCILLFMAGGPSHLDTWDPKPSAGLDYTGPFKPIPTNVDGIQVCEHLPRLATMADRYSLIRSVRSGENSHERGQHYLQTGYEPLPTMEFPSIGAVVGKERGGNAVLPPYILINQRIDGQGPGYLGEQLAPFFAGEPGRPDYRLPDGQSMDTDFERQTRRKALLQAIDTLDRDQERVKTMDEYYRRAMGLMESPEAREAFEISKEPSALRDGYGRDSLGQSCLLARRLVEAGVPFVTVTQPGWDTHSNNFNLMQNNLLPSLDRSLSQLLTDIHDRDMLDSTLVVVMGEFGRTPRINAASGRDHWADAWSVLMAGGGVKGGLVHGRTDDRGEKVVQDPVTPENLSATILAAMDIDYTKYYETPSGRPIRLSPGEPIRSVLR
jgi:hypothetical protein